MVFAYLRPNYLLNMKHILFLLATLALSFSAQADAWDNLTKEEAERVVEKLEAQPYIFDYCDCCDAKGEYAAKTYFIKVTKTEIVPCSWDAQYFSVKMTYTILAEVKYTSKGINTKKLKAHANSVGQDIFTMNYHWGLNTAVNKADAFFNLVDYSLYGSDRKSCKTPFSYPTPQALGKITNDPEYGTWYKNQGL